MAKLTRKDVLAGVSEMTGLPVSTCDGVLRAFVDFTVTSCMEKDTAVPLKGIGIFEKKTLKARKGRNPKTGAAVDVPASVGLKLRVKLSHGDE
jgi:DNA-binding protein HU-beta